MPEDPQVVAQDSSIQTASDAASVSAPSEPSAESTPAADSQKVERDRRAQEGREKAALERRATLAEQALAQTTAQFSALQQRLNSIDAREAARVQAEQEAQLAALPPDQRTAAQVQALQQRLNAQDEEAYRQRRKLELTQQANTAFGLTGETALTGSETELDDSSEATYIASLRAYGTALQRHLASSPSTTQTEGEPQMAKKEELSVEDKIQAGIKAGVEEALREVGVGRSNSPRAASAAGSADAESIDKDLRDATRRYDPRNPGATRAALRAANEAARSLAPGGRR